MILARSPVPLGQKKSLTSYSIIAMPTVYRRLLSPLLPSRKLEDRARSRLTNTDFCQIFTIRSKPPALYSNSWAPWFELQKEMTFESFDWKRVNLPLEQRQNLEAAYKLALEFAKSPDGWLVFAGVNGAGKTHLASAIVNYRYNLGRPSLFIVVPDFLDHLRSTFNPDSKVSYDQLFETVRSSELLVLDDFGEQAGTPWAQEKLYQVINPPLQCPVGNGNYNIMCAGMRSRTVSVPDCLTQRLVYFST